jgi:UDP-2-acetamido-3-amino-2,3-dideoxy-glucuronate N-acetyltransferase
VPVDSNATIRTQRNAPTPPNEAASRGMAQTDPTVFVHPSAICESGSVGDGSRVWAFAHIMDGAVVGRDCNIGDHAFIESGVHVGHRVTIKNGVMLFRGVSVEDDVFIGPGVTFTNDKYPRSPRMPEVAGRYARSENWLAPTVVRHGATIGAGAVILPGVTIGPYATVGAGGVVTRDVADHRLVLGNPARAVGWMCVCGFPLREPWTCGKCRRRYETRNDQLALVE